MSGLEKYGLDKFATIEDVEKVYEAKRKYEEPVKEIARNNYNKQRNSFSERIKVDNEDNQIERNAMNNMQREINQAKEKNQNVENENVI